MLVFGLRLWPLASSLNSKLFLSFKSFESVSSSLFCQSFSSLLKGGYLENIFDPIVRVDVDNRCAVMLVYGRHLVVLPFKQDIAVEDTEHMQTGFVHI